MGVAVSGGIDSVALLRLLLELRGELGIVLCVVHFNHKLRGAESDADEKFVANLAREHNLSFHNGSGDVAAYAVDERVSVEAAARELRYEFFRDLIEARTLAESPTLSAKPRQGWAPEDPDGEERPLPLLAKPARSGAPHSGGGLRPGGAPHPDYPGLNRIATGHTLDDQAETVLLHMIRGAGLRGLGGIHPRLVVEDEEGELQGEIVRPLLGIRRRELEQYLKDIGQSWREDSTNDDAKFTRNRLRKLVVPLLEKEFNPSVAENLAELAEIARGEEDYWENEVAGWAGTAIHWSEPDWARVESNSTGLVRIALAANGQPSHVMQNRRDVGHPTAEANLQSKIDSAPWLVANASVSRAWFVGEPVAVQRRVVKAIGERAGIPLEFKHVAEILRFAAEDGPRDKELSLPLGWTLVRKLSELLFMTPDLREPAAEVDYEVSLAVPGQTSVGAAGSTIDVRRIPAGETAEYNPDHLLDSDSVTGSLKARNWRAGDKFWPAHRKSPKKIKELLQERRVAQRERKLWPVIVSGDEILWVRGFATPAKHQPRPGRDAILITESFGDESKAQYVGGFALGRFEERDISMNASRVESLRQVITTEQIQKRIKELARQISDDYQGQTIQMLAVLENAFMFLADLVRAIEVPVVCQFIKPKYTRPTSNSPQEVMEIFFSHEPDIRGRHILLVEGLVHSGVTSEFLMSDLKARGAASVKLVTLLDRQSARRVPLQPDYFGFLVDETFLVGYGLGAVEQTNRNLPFLAAAPMT